MLRAQYPALRVTHQRRDSRQATEQRPVTVLVRECVPTLRIPEQCRSTPALV